MTPPLPRACGVWLALSGLGPRMAGCHLAAGHDGAHQHRRTITSLVEGAPPAVEVIQWWTEKPDDTPNPAVQAWDAELDERPWA